tara:strand:- start:734 stop:910 length:177 start_codon:yes stop_codon:yes gene_type:complete
MKQTKIKEYYDELHLIEEFESNFNITTRSRQRREKLLKLLNTLQNKNTSDNIYVTNKN